MASSAFDGKPQAATGMSRAHPTFFFASLVVATLTVLGGSGLLLTARSTASAAPRPVLGVIGASGSHLPIEAQSGVRSITIVMNWSLAQPGAHTSSESYVASIDRRIGTAHDDGFAVTIDPGLQYPPAWVFALAGGTRFVDQYGDEFTGPPSSGDDVANGVTDGAVRAVMQSYLAWLGRHLRLSEVTSVRQGGGPFDELRYPGPSYDGHSNCYWAYDSSSQASSPALSYVPGTSTGAAAEAFLDRYNADLISFAEWMNGQYRLDFDRRILLLLPGWGQRPGVAADQERSLLRLPFAEFNEGLDWTGLLPFLPDRAQTVAYTTYLDAPSFADNPDPADYLASLARPLHMLLGGENTGVETLRAMNETLVRARELGLVIVNWFGESQLVAATEAPAGGAPTFADLRQAAQADL